MSLFHICESFCVIISFWIFQSLSLFLLVSLPPIFLSVLSMQVFIFLHFSHIKRLTSLCSKVYIHAWTPSFNISVMIINMICYSLIFCHYIIYVLCPCVYPWAKTWCIYYFVFVSSSSKTICLWQTTCTLNIFLNFLLNSDRLACKVLQFLRVVM